MLGNSSHGFRTNSLSLRITKKADIGTSPLGSGLIDQIQKMTTATMKIAEKKVCAYRS
jgi:hypothetical protein